MHIVECLFRNLAGDAFAIHKNIDQQQMIVRPARNEPQTGVRERLGQNSRIAHDLLLIGFEITPQGFAERATSVREMLLSSQSGFVVIAAAEPDSLEQAAALSRRLASDGFPMEGVILNRVHPLPSEEPPEAATLERALAAAGASDPRALAERAVDALDDERALALRDRAARESLREAIGVDGLIEVPELAREPVELPGIAEVAEALGG